MAVSQLQRATDLAQALVIANPDDTAMLDHASAAYADLGESLYYGGDATGARTAVAQARDLAAHLVQRDPSVVAWQSRLSRSLLLEARLAAAGEELGALREIQGVLQRLDTLRQSNRLDRRARLLYAQGLLMAANCNASLGNTGQARDGWERALAAVQDDRSIAGPSAEAIVATALQKLDRGDEAAQVLARLDGMGYRHPGLIRSSAPQPAVTPSGIGPAAG